MNQPTRHHRSLTVPARVDVHCHGGGGASFATTHADEAAAAASFHHRCGTTRLLASLVSGSADDLVAWCRTLAPLAASGSIEGIHLEGPYISTARCGAHAPAVLRDPDLDELNRLWDASDGAIRMLTIAPELDGAREAIEWCTERGVIASIGHTDCDAELAAASIDWGITHATHVCNAMRSIHHRAPGPIPVVVNDSRVTLELIIDGQHVAEPVASMIAEAAGADRLAAVSDCTAPAGQPDGEYRLGDVVVTKRGNRVVVADNGALAGSVTPLDLSAAVANGWGWAPDLLAAAYSHTPARVLGIECDPVTGPVGDEVVVDADTLAVMSVRRSGEWLS